MELHSGQEEVRGNGEKSGETILESGLVHISPLFVGPRVDSLRACKHTE